MNRHPRILLIEQDKDFRNLIVPQLRSSFVVLIANDAVESLSIAVIHKPEAILVDLKLEGKMSGFHLIKAIRENITLQAIPVIALSNDADKSSVISVVQAGANDFLIKSNSCYEALSRKLIRLLNPRKEKPNSDSGFLAGLDTLKSLSLEEKSLGESITSYDESIELPAGTTSRMLHLTGITEIDSENITDGVDQSIENRINPFIKHTSIVLKKLLNWNLKRAAIVTRNSYAPSHEVSSVISMHGAYSGTIVLSLSREVVFSLVQLVNDSKISHINEDVINTIAELTNIIAGRASADLLKYETRIGLPTVMVGHTKVAPFPQGSTPLCVSFLSEGGPLTLEIGFEFGLGLEVPQNVTQDSSNAGSSTHTPNDDKSTNKATMNETSEPEKSVQNATAN